TLSGIVRGHVAAKKHGIRFIPACRLDLQDGTSLLAYPIDRAAYGRLSTLLTEGNRRTEKGKCCLYKSDVYRHAQGIQFVVIPYERLASTLNLLKAFVDDITDYRKELVHLFSIVAFLIHSRHDAK